MTENCSGMCSSCKEGNCALRKNLANIKHKVVVLSGKGGVGKSTVAVNLAMGLVKLGLKVGLLDVDIHGPSVPVMLGLQDAQVMADANSSLMLPAEKDGLKVISSGFLIPDKDAAVIWRGPMKTGVIKQFIEEVKWDNLDYLIVDCPPGTGDEPLSVCQFLDSPDGAIVVTTPQDVAAADVRKSISFCNKIDIPVLGVVENMSGFVCPKCGEVTEIFKSGGGEKLAKQFDVPFLGKLPIDAQVGISGDEGKAFIENDSPVADAFNSVIGNIRKQLS